MIQVLQFVDKCAGKCHQNVKQHACSMTKFFMFNTKTGSNVLLVTWDTKAELGTKNKVKRLKLGLI